MAPAICEAGTTEACTCEDGNSSTRRCAIAGQWSGCSCGGVSRGTERLEQMRARMVGVWSGTVDTDWVGIVCVRVEFLDDGTYATLTTGGIAPAFYWNTDGYRGQRWELIDEQASGYILGEVDFVLSETGVGRWDGRITRLEMSDDGSQLTFQLAPRDGEVSRPLAVTLHRER